VSHARALAMCRANLDDTGCHCEEML
jgi:hypothetical protein